MFLGILASQQDKLDAFAKWADENGFERKFDLVAIPGQGTGGIATNSISANDVLLTVPKDKLVTTSSVIDINGWRVCRFQSSYFILFLITFCFQRAGLKLMSL